MMCHLRRITLAFALLCQILSRAFLAVDDRERAMHTASGCPLFSLLLQTVIVRGTRSKEGTLVEAVALPWFTS
jgi:hypothetical protein